MLELTRIAKRYRSGEENIPAIDGVTLAVNPGEMLALQGPSGSGKTTLLLLAAGAMKADEGSVLYQGRNLAGMSEGDLAQYRLATVGLVAQQTHLMPRVSALENAATKLILGGVAVHDARNQAMEWLERVGLAGRAERTPEELSGGERQRVAIARALAGHPHLILADEPTANLDSERSRETISLLATLAQDQGAGVLLVTHDPEVAKAAARIIRLRDGRLQPEQEEVRGPA